MRIYYILLAKNFKKIHGNQEFSQGVHMYVTLLSALLTLSERNSRVEKQPSRAPKTTFREKLPKIGSRILLDFLSDRVNFWVKL